MSIARRLLPVLLLFAPTTHAAGDWPIESRAIVSRQNNRAWPGRLDPFTRTLVDGLHLKLRGWDGVFPGARALRVLATSPEFLTPAGRPRGLEVTHWGADDAPLAVYLPGIFQMSNDADTARVVDALLEAGYHAVVIANPLSREYMDNDPVAPGASYDREAAIVHETIGELRRRFTSPAVRLIAASHGVNLAVRTWTIDQHRPTAQVDDLTLLFPQVRVAASIDLVDGFITTAATTHPARAAIGAIYRRGLENYVERRRRRFVLDRDAGFAARAYSARAAEHLGRYDAGTDGGALTLRRVLADYVDDAEVTRGNAPDAPDLFAWLDRARAVRGNARVRLMTAEDDWTNPPGAWRDRPEWLRPTTRTLILKNAGHAGMVHHAWFRAAIVAALR